MNVQIINLLITHESLALWLHRAKLLEAISSVFTETLSRGHGGESNMSVRETMISVWRLFDYVLLPSFSHLFSVCISTIYELYITPDAQIT